MPRRNANKYRPLRRFIAGILFAIAGVWFFHVGFPKPNLSWERLYILAASLASLSVALAYFTTKDKLIANASRIFVGAIFVFSGFVKIIDPLGSAYKFDDYFNAWGMDFMTPYSLLLSFILSVSEMVVGLSLLFNIFAAVAAYGALFFMLYFTPVTLYLALQEHITGKELVHDCGCFGDAFLLTNWQTFVKNIILLVPTIVIFKRKTLYISIFSEAAQGIILTLSIFLTAGIGYWGVEHLPLIDFRPFKKGTNIPEKMSIPPGAPQPKYDTFLIYKDKKTGVEKEFTLANYPQDTSWVFVDSKNILVSEGYKPPIQNFTINSPVRGDITEEVLQDKKHNFLVVAYDLNKTKPEAIPELNRLYDWCRRNGIAFRCLTSSVESDVEQFKKKTGAMFEFFNADPVTLKTMVRANPGLILLKQGTVIDMWHYNDMPSIATFDNKLLTK